MGSVEVSRGVSLKQGSERAVLGPHASFGERALFKDEVARS